MPPAAPPKIRATVIDAARALSSDLMDVTGVRAVAFRQNRVLIYVTHARVGAKIPKVKNGVRGSRDPDRYGSTMRLVKKSARSMRHLLSDA